MNGDEILKNSFNRRVMNMYDKDRKKQEAIEVRRNFIKNKMKKRGK